MTALISFFSSSLTVSALFKITVLQNSSCCINKESSESSSSTGSNKCLPQLNSFDNLAASATQMMLSKWNNSGNPLEYSVSLAAVMVCAIGIGSQIPLASMMM